MSETNQSPQHVEIYKGVIEFTNYGEDDDALRLGDIVLAHEIETDMELYGRFLSVRYFITDEPKTWDEATEDLVKHLAGVGEAEYTHHYSEITGYLWTDQELKVGGHDLLEELRTHEGKHLLLEVKYSQEPKPPGTVKTLSFGEHLTLQDSATKEVS